MRGSEINKLTSLKIFISERFYYLYGYPQSLQKAALIIFLSLQFRESKNYLISSVAKCQSIFFLKKVWY